MHTCKPTEEFPEKCPTHSTTRQTQFLSSRNTLNHPASLRKSTDNSSKTSCDFRKKIFQSPRKGNLRFEGSTETRLTSNLTNKMFKTQVVQGNTARKSQQKIKKKQGSEQKVLPESLKIVYYGPLGKKSRSIAKNNRVKETDKPNKQIENIYPKKLEVNSIIKTMEIPSRYYDLNTTKASSEESKKLTVTYYPLTEKSVDHSTSTKGWNQIKLTGQVALYVLLLVTGIILILKATLT